MVPARRSRLLPALAVAGLLAVTAGCGSSPAKRSDAPSGATVHLTDYTDNDGPTSTVILAGAVGDYGTAQSVRPDGSVDPEHGSQLSLTLQHGTFRLDITDLHKAFVTTLGTLAANTATCSGTASVTGDAPVVRGSGTSRYQGITGSFHLTITLDEVYRQPACAPTDAYLSQSIVITGPGTVSLG